MDEQQPTKRTLLYRSVHVNQVGKSVSIFVHRYFSDESTECRHYASYSGRSCEFNFIRARRAVALMYAALGKMWEQQ
jgi:hypothetical protein